MQKLFFTFLTDKSWIGKETMKNVIAQKKIINQTVYDIGIWWDRTQKFFYNLPIIGSRCLLIFINQLVISYNMVIQHYYLTVPTITINIYYIST